MLTTEGHLLGGRVIHRQPASGFRSGIEPVLLAASIPARAGERVLEAGTGAGAALLCLRFRVPGVLVIGVEIEAALAGLARNNADANGFGGVEIIAGSIETIGLDGLFDHVLANPPYHHPEGTVSPIAAREAAKRGSDALLAAWIERLSSALHDRGSMTLIVPAGVVPTCLAAMSRSRCPCSALFPLWPMAGRSAKLSMLRGIKAGRTRMRLSPGLVLHNPDGAFTDHARAILNDAAPLPL